MERFEQITQQLNMPFYQLLADVKFIDQYLVSKCKSENDAILLCWNKRRTKFTLTRASEILGIPKSHLSNILNGKKYFPNGMQQDFQLMCGNWAIRQHEDFVLGTTTAIETVQQKIERLEIENAMLRRTA